MHAPPMTLSPPNWTPWRPGRSSPCTACAPNARRPARHRHRHRPEPAHTCARPRHGPERPGRNREPTGLGYILKPVEGEPASHHQPAGPLLRRRRPVHLLHHPVPAAAPQPPAARHPLLQPNTCCGAPHQVKKGVSPRSGGIPSSNKRELRYVKTRNQERDLTSTARNLSRGTIRQRHSRPTETGRHWQQSTWEIFTYFPLPSQRGLRKMAFWD